MWIVVQPEDLWFGSTPWWGCISSKEVDIFMGRLTTSVEIMNFQYGKAVNGLKNGLLVACTELQQTLSVQWEVQLGCTYGLYIFYMYNMGWHILRVHWNSFHSCASYGSPILVTHSLLPFWFCFFIFPFFECLRNLLEILNSGGSLCLHRMNSEFNYSQ